MQSMFDFQLLDTYSSIQKNNYNWFWLTDGYYWCNMGKQKLFELSDEIIEYDQINIQTDMQKCVDYQVVRFWEDMLDILPNIINPVPTEIHYLLQQPLDKINKNIEQWLDYVEQEEQSGRYQPYELLCNVPSFFDGHLLTTMHLTYSPVLYFGVTKQIMLIIYGLLGILLKQKSMIIHNEKFRYGRQRKDLFISPFIILCKIFKNLMINLLSKCNIKLMRFYILSI